MSISKTLKSKLLFSSVTDARNFGKIKPRAEYMMAMPFVVNDAIITKQKINL